MDVLVLPSGPTIRNSQSLGREERGCRLNPDALETAVCFVRSSLLESDCLIVIKFGKHEAEGRGFRTVIAEALALELPVLVGLNELNAEAFLEFSGGLAQKIDPSARKIEHWLFRSIAARRDVAC